MRNTLVTIASLFLVGCSPVQLKQESRVGSFPDLNVVTNVNVGEVMVTEFNYSAINSAVITQSVDSNLWHGRRALPAGTTLSSTTTSDGKNLFCEPQGGASAWCFEDENQDGKFDRAYTLNAFNTPLYGDELEGISYQKNSAMGNTGLKWELLYQGLESDVIKIAYREYSNDLARPAFQQDLSYTLQDDATEVRFRKVVLTIISATNSQITYTVDSGLGN